MRTWRAITRRHRRGAVYVPDWRAFCRPLDRNARARLYFLADALETRTKARDRKNGVLGTYALRVLHTLLFRFLNAEAGLLCPSYEALQRATRFCRQTITSALARLEAAGILSIVRRLVPHVWQDSSGAVRHGAVQGTNLYAVHEPGPWAHAGAPATGRTRFPPARQLVLAAMWRRTGDLPLPSALPDPSLRDSRDLTPGAPPDASIASGWRGKAVFRGSAWRDRSPEAR